MLGEQRTRTLLGPADPAHRTVVPPPPVSAADLMAREGNVDDAAPARPNRRAVLVGAVATVAAGAYPLVRSTRDGGRPSDADRSSVAGVVVPIAYQIPAKPPPAGRYLRELAARVANAPYDIHLGRYTYHHVKWWGGMTVRSPEGYVMSYVDETETWTAKDGSGRRRFRTLPPEYPDEESRRHYENLSRSSTQNTQPATRPHEDLPAGLAGPADPLPNDRARLAKLLNVEHGPGAIAKSVATAYEQHGIPRSTRALILDTLAGAAGWSWRGEVTDRAGRSGVAITGEDHGQQAVLVFDPRTGMLLAHERVLPAPKRRVGAYQLLLAMDRTDRLG
jgi:hypothetical protein